MVTGVTGSGNPSHPSHAVFALLKAPGNPSQARDGLPSDVTGSSLICDGFRRDRYRVLIVAAGLPRWRCGCRR